jgi:hypothetical protein
MPALSKRQILARWKKLAEDRSPGAWQSEEDVSGLFEKFAPDGKGAEAIFEGVKQGNEVCKRLREVYRATRGAEAGLYFVPTPAKPPTRAAVEKLLKQHFARLTEMCRAIQDDEGAALLKAMPRIEWVQDEPEPSDAGQEQESRLVDVRIDFLDTCRGSKSHALLLEEALYMATTSPAVQDYVLWPLRRDRSAIKEPFRPEFELWKLGVTWRWKDSRTLAVHIAPPKKPAKKPAKATSHAPSGSQMGREFPAAAALARLGKRDRDEEKRYERQVSEELQPKKPVLGSLVRSIRMHGLAIGETAVEAILRGVKTGWAELLRAFRYFVWDYRIQTACRQEQLEKKLVKNPWLVFRVDEGDAISTLALAIALRQDAFADFCGDRVLRNFLRGDLLNKEMEWGGSPGAPFMALLYARWRGREDELRKKAVKGSLESLRKDQPHFRTMVDQWEHDEAFAKGFHAACDAFAEAAGGEHGPMFWWAFPAELLAIARIRRELGRPDPLATHALGRSLLAQVPELSPKPPKDKFYDQAVARCQQAFPKLALTPGW